MNKYTAVTNHMYSDVTKRKHDLMLVIASN